MDSLPYHLYTCDQIRAVEKFAIEDLKIPAETLMQRAGIAAFAALREYWTQAKKIVVVCGTGNNGGDGYALAKLAKQQGLQVTVYYIGNNDNLKDAALKAYKECVANQIVITPFTDIDLKNTDVIIDAILGIGINGEVKDAAKSAIEKINASKLPVLALDIPSGIDADTGKVLGTAINADVTATFVALKQGLFAGEAPNYCGRIVFDDLHIENNSPFSVERITYDTQHRFLPARSRIAHKGDFGHTLIIGGDYGLAGAARITAEAALRVGSGLVSVATRIEHVGAITGARPEIMVHGVKQISDLIPLMERATVIAIGPGLGQAQWGQEIFDLVSNTELPLVVDADALNILAKKSCRKENWILTPHPGEAARLLQRTTQEIQNNRFQAIYDLQKQLGGTIVLKGAGTLIKNSQQHLQLCNDGNPGMASGGMGDLLTGVLAGLIAQKIPLTKAAALAVAIHARAGDIARKNGERGMLALDLLAPIRMLVNP